MTTKIEIANIGLGMIGANLLTSLDDDSDEARLVKLNYDAARDATLEAQEWTFAIKRFQPSASATPPLFAWGFSYPIPSDILRVLTCDRLDSVGFDQLNESGVTQFDQIDWIVEDRAILTNMDIVYARGIRRVTEEGKYSPLFVHAFAAKLAALMAYPLTQSSTIMQNAAALYVGFMGEAKSRDGIQGRSRRIRNQSLLNSR